MNKQSPVGFFDSGMGGISTLRSARRLLPGEDYLYYGDSENAPYGVKTEQQVCALSQRAAELLLEKGAKALVIACNTATAAAAEYLRSLYPDVIIVGTEPAVKLAVEHCPGGRVLVMATAGTLASERFQTLYKRFEEKAQIVPVPCTGLMEFVEQGKLSGPEVEQFLVEKLEPFTKVPVNAVVLGCTHYPFLEDAIRNVLGKQVAVFDSADGVARQLRRRLEEKDLLNERPDGGSVTFLNTCQQLSETLMDAE